MVEYSYIFSFNVLRGRIFRRRRHCEGLARPSFCRKVVMMWVAGEIESNEAALTRRKRRRGSGPSYPPAHVLLCRSHLKPKLCDFCGPRLHFRAYPCADQLGSTSDASSRSNAVPCHIAAPLPAFIPGRWTINWPKT